MANSPKVDAARAADRERIAKALELRKAGATYEKIAQLLGYASKGSAHTAVKNALKEITSRPAEEIRSIEITRLETIITILWPKIRAGDLKAIETFLKVQNQLAQFTGAYRPAKIAFTNPEGDEAWKLEAAKKGYDLARLPQVIAVLMSNPDNANKNPQALLRMAQDKLTTPAQAVIENERAERLADDLPNGGDDGG